MNNPITMPILFLLQSITKFESLANQIQKNAGDIDERLKMIESVRLFKQPPPKPGVDLMDAKVHYNNRYTYSRTRCLDIYALAIEYISCMYKFILVCALAITYAYIFNKWCI